MGREIPSKVCVHCGRSFSWRKKWEGNWEEVKFCSDRCRRTGRNKIHRDYEEVILSLLEERGPGKTICPSEAARHLHPDEKGWREAMEDVRNAARRLARRERIHILKKNQVIDPDEMRGVIRLGLVGKE